MNKLHFYRNIGGHISWTADGDGTVNSSSEFSVLLTRGNVQRGYAYEIRQGTSPSGEQYNCLTGGSKGENAKFKKASELNLWRANEEFFGATMALQVALAASQKSVTIKIDTQDLEDLKHSDYKLCFAKKVAEDVYNVVWQSYTQYLASNVFSWTPQYQLFGSNIFQDGVEVQSSTEIVNIGLGQQSTLNKEGVWSDVATGGPDTSINIINDYGSIHPGVNQLSTGINGKVLSTAIYVAAEPILKGSAKLTPIEKVLVWFEQNIETSTMFSSARSFSEEIDLTSINKATRLYKNQTWSIV